MSLPRRHDLAAVGALVLLWIAVWVPRLQGPIDLRWDASTYYVLGTSLAEGCGYRLLNEPGQIQAVQYPPIVPLIVAAHERALGTSNVLTVAWYLRLCYFVLSGLYLLAAYALARTLLAPPYALLVAATTGLSFYGFLYLSDALYAEIPFGLLSLSFLLCHRRSERRAFAVATGIFGAAAYLCRTAGMALLAAWVLESLGRRRFGQALVRGAVAAVPIVLWWGYVHNVTHGDAYRRLAYPYQRAPWYYTNVTYGENSNFVDPFRPELGRTSSADLGSRVVHNLAVIPRVLGESTWIPVRSELYVLDKLQRVGHVPLPEIAPTLAASALKVSLVLIGLGAVLGAVLVATSGEWFLSLYFAVTIGMIVLTPWPSQFWRYLAPMVPLTMLFFIVTLGRTDEWFRRRGGAIARTAGSVVGTIPLSVMLLVQVFIASSFLRTLLPVSWYDRAGHEHPYRLLTYEPVWHALDPALEWVRRHAPPDAVLATSVPQLAYLRTDRKTVMPPLDPDPVAAAHLLDSVPASYLLVDRLGLPGISERYVAPLVIGRAGEWRLAFTSPDGQAQVYARVR
jgi:hypothetical protein